MNPADQRTVEHSPANNIRVGGVMDRAIQKALRPWRSANPFAGIDQDVGPPLWAAQGERDRLMPHGMRNEMMDLFDLPTKWRNALQRHPALPALASIGR